MANIEAFRALMLEKDALDLLLNQEQDAGADNIFLLDELLANNKGRIEQKSAIWICEFKKGPNIQTGIWVLTDLNDMVSGGILIHENTLPYKVEELKSHRGKGGMESSPILLTHRPDSEIESLILIVKSTQLPDNSPNDSYVNRLWKVTESSMIDRFKGAFKRIKRVYLADGHHRLAAAQILNTETTQFISSLYISCNELRISAFHRIIKAQDNISQDEIFNVLRKYYYISPVPNNVCYRPDRKNRLGFYHKNIWYRLDLKNIAGPMSSVPDVCILQEKILRPFFGIKNPGTDDRLVVIPDIQWYDFVCQVKREKGSIGFTLFPMTIDQLLAKAESGTVLPPKSTYIEPKIPVGLLVYAPS